MYKPDYNDCYVNNAYCKHVASLLKTVENIHIPKGKNRAEKFYRWSMGMAIIDENFDKQLHNELVDYWIKYNAAAICNYKYGFNRSAPTLLHELCGTIFYQINEAIRLGKHEIQDIKKHILLRLANDGIPPYLIRNIEYLSLTNSKNALTELISQIVTQTTDIKKEDASWFTSDDKINKYKAQINKIQNVFKEALSPFVCNYSARCKYIVFIGAAHASTQSGKHAFYSQIFEWKWSRLFGDLLQAALLKMGFTAIKVTPEDGDYGTGVKKTNNGCFVNVVNHNFGSMAPIDSYTLGARIKYLKSILNVAADKCISIIPHLNAGTWPGGYADGVYYWKVFSYSYRPYLIRTYANTDKGDLLSTCILTSIKEHTDFKFNSTKESMDGGINVVRSTDEKGDGSVSGCVRSDMGGVTATVLTENLMQDNKDDINYLRSTAGMNMLVFVHALGILKYIVGSRNKKLYVGTDITAQSIMNVVAETEKQFDDNNNIKSMESELRNTISSLCIKYNKNTTYLNGNDYNKPDLTISDIVGVLNDATDTIKLGSAVRDGNYRGDKESYNGVTLNTNWADKYSMRNKNIADKKLEPYSAIVK